MTQAPTTVPALDQQAAVIASLQQTITELQAQSLIQNSRKRRRGGNAPAGTQHSGRPIRRLVSINADIFTILVDGQRIYRERKAAEDDGDIDDDLLGLADNAALTDEERKIIETRQMEDRRLNEYITLHAVVPTLENKRRELKDKPEELAEFIKALSKGANDTRSTDLTNVKNWMVDWLNDSKLSPEPRLTKDVSNRGIKHDVCGGLMTPIQYDWDNEEVRDKIRHNDAQFPLSISFFFRLFYRNFRGDVNNVDEGFLKSPLLIKAAKMILTSPSSATGGVQLSDDEGPENPPEKRQHTDEHAVTTKRNLRKNNAAIMGLDGKITPRLIAYICVLTWFSLSGVDWWRDSYMGVSFHALYDWIVDYFESPKDGTVEKKIADDLLAWWVRAVFPHYRGVASQSTPVTNSNNILAQQRRARARAQTTF
ncbi:hypothetical protein DL96DRAFT_1686893 [Flagelloscypha sp. PMI_526]|nr:hypothetical protein DL96DRAFT_1686893 [Flagelloscypha sp. PMI_526]